MSRRIILLGACLAFVAMPRSLRAQLPDVQISVPPVMEKLGVKPMPTTPRELELGKSATTMLADPKKIAEYGIKDVHEGARVTITCIGPSHVRVEADEMEPVSVRAVVTLKIADDGSMTPVPDRPVPKTPR